MIWPQLTPATVSLTLLAAVLAGRPGDVQAHPHIFVDTGLSVQVDAAGQLQAIEITWAYDEFYSLLIFEDQGLDTDGDGTLSSAEMAQLQGFDLRWSEGYLGDIYVTSGGDAEAALAVLGPPDHLSTTVVDGRITSRHRRVLQQPIAADGAVIRAYDPTYYTAYTMTQGVSPAQFMEIIPQCAGTSWALESRGPHVRDGDYTPLSAVDIWPKDLGIVMDIAHGAKFGAPITAAALQQFMAASGSGLGREDDAAVAKIYARNAGLTLPGQE